MCSSHDPKVWLRWYRACAHIKLREAIQESTVILTTLNALVRVHRISKSRFITLLLCSQCSAVWAATDSNEETGADGHAATTTDKATGRSFRERPSPTRYHSQTGTGCYCAFLTIVRTGDGYNIQQANIVIQYPCTISRRKMWKSLSHAFHWKKDNSHVISVS